MEVLYLKTSTPALHIHNKHSNRVVRYQVQLFFLLKNVTNLHDNTLLICKYSLLWVHKQNSNLRQEPGQQYSTSFYYFISGKWDVSYYYLVFIFITVIVRSLKWRKLTYPWDTRAVGFSLPENILMILYTANITRAFCPHATLWNLPFSL